MDDVTKRELVEDLKTATEIVQEAYDWMVPGSVLSAAVFTEIRVLRREELAQAARNASNRLSRGL